MIEDPRTKICHTIKDANFMYGGEIYILTDKDIEILKSGLIINFSVNDEYGCTLQYDAPDAE